MTSAWRIVKARHRRRAMDGEGARLAGGRWNRPGSRMVYTSESAALATLELLVHLGTNSLLSSYVLVECSFAETLVEDLDLARLPSNWRSYPAPVALQTISEEWLRSRRSAVLAAPSAVVDTEINYLLNPLHRDFKRIATAPPKPFQFDERLVRRARTR